MAVTSGRKSVANRTSTLKVGDPAPDLELQGYETPPGKVITKAIQ